MKEWWVQVNRITPTGHMPTPSFGYIIPANSQDPLDWSRQDIRKGLNAPLGRSLTTYLDLISLMFIH